MHKSSRLIANSLESAYDIPFVVTWKGTYNEPEVVIKPKRNELDLFSLKVLIKQRTRIIIEFMPDKYCAPMFADMATSSIEKKNSFVNYSKYITNTMKASMKMRINEVDTSLEDFTNWPEEWRSFYCRITKIPVVNDEETFDSVEIIKEWSIIAFGMFLSLLDVVPIENNRETAGVADRAKSEIPVTRYERNPLNRQLCLAAWGYQCQICKFDFSAKYGLLGNEFIHVHHIEEVSTYGGERLINPVVDLIPVCPNCHAMLHRRKPALKPDELIEIIEKEKKCKEV